jgi:ABC-2 type transport system permease protein
VSPTLLAHQFRTLLRRGRLIGLLLLAIVPAVIVLVVGLAEGPNPDLVADGVAGLASTTFPIAALILAAATLRDERDAGTLPYIYLKPISRFGLAVTSVVAAASATAVLGLTSAAALVGSAAVVGADMGAATASIPLYLAVAVGYSAMFVPLGYLLPRIVLIGLAYVILWEQVIARLVTGVANTSVWRFALSIYADIVGDQDLLSEALGPVAPGAWGGVAKIGVVVTLGVGLLTWTLRWRDAV